MDKLSFASDYMEGAHPLLMERLAETNLIPCGGYGLDEYSESARNRVREACAAPDADVFFLVGGTQANECVISSILQPYQGIIAADTGHISVHEAGAIEHSGHKVLPIPHEDGKLAADAVEAYLSAWRNDGNHEHMVMPGAVYISQPTEYGTLYSLSELEALSRVCHEYGIALYLDGARLAYALASSGNDVALPDIARTCDAFYIGGTKCGALFGEAVVFPEHNRIPHFFTIIKQHGALLAKGRVLGVQFDELFRDGLYGRIGANAIEAADRIREACKKYGIEFAIETPTNQLFPIFDDEQLALMSECVEMSFWERTEDGRTVMRIATSWATRPEDVDALLEVLQQISA